MFTLKTYRLRPLVFIFPLCVVSVSAVKLIFPRKRLCCVYKSEKRYGAGGGGSWTEASDVRLDVDVRLMIEAAQSTGCCTCCCCLLFVRPCVVCLFPSVSRDGVSLLRPGRPCHAKIEFNTQKRPVGWRFCGFLIYLF